MEYKTSDQYEEEGLEHYRRDEFAQALHRFQEGVTRFPGDRDLLLGAAMAHLNLGDFVEAAAILEDLRARFGSSGDVLQGLAEANLSLGRRDAAVAYVRQALDGGAGSASLANRLGRVVYKHGLLAEAARCHALAVRRGPLQAAAYVGLGVCNHRMGRVEQAVRILQKALELEPDNIEALSYLGNIHYDRKDSARALELWGRIPLGTLGDPATLRRMRNLSRQAGQESASGAIESRLKEVLKSREPGVQDLLERLAPAGDAAGPR